MKRLPVILSFLLFVMLSVSAAYWALQLYKPPVRDVSAPPPVAQLELKLDAVAGLFGGRASAVIASNYQLTGVVDANNNAKSIVVLSADGKPPKAVAVGSEFAPGVTVKEVHPKHVILSEGGVLKRVDLPEPVAASGNNGNNGSFVSPAPQPDINSAPTYTAPQPQPESGMPSPPPQPPPENQQGQVRSMQRIGR